MAELLYKDLSYQVVGAAMEVHRTLGSGFLEAVYHAAMPHELRLQQISFETKESLPVACKGHIVGQYEADLVVDEKIIVELKAVSALSAAHIAQARHYLTATGLRLALLLIFGRESLEMKRVVK